MKWIKSLFYILLMGLAVSLFMAVNGLHGLELWDLPSLFFIFAGWLFVFLNYSPSEIVQAFAQAVGVGKSDQSLKLSYQILGNLGKYGLLAGGACFLLGTVQALGNLDDLKALGMAFALSLLGMIYALGVYLFVVIPLQNSLQHQICEQEVF